MIKTCFDTIIFIKSNGKKSKDKYACPKRKECKLYQNHLDIMHGKINPKKYESVFAVYMDSEDMRELINKSKCYLKDGKEIPKKFKGL